MTENIRSPYADLPADAFWRSGVAARAPLDPGALYTPKFLLRPQEKIMTAGSCFAQHVGRHLRKSGANVIDTEPLEAPIDNAEANRFGYRLYSARYGNIYTPRQLLQLVREVRGEWEPSDWIWERDGRYYDAFRPAVDPNGLASAEDVIAQRKLHLAAVEEAFKQASLFVFTFGLTEAWEQSASGTIFPTAPGTIAGDFDPESYRFKNFSYDEVLRDFIQFRSLMKRYSKRMRFLITVSPVPLTATATGKHVEVATSYSKSVLRAVCGHLSDKFKDVDYFPSYEVITSPANHGAYFMPNRRSVAPSGVAAAMSLFLEQHRQALSDASETAAKSAPPQVAPPKSEEDVICEEALLEAFAK